MHILETYIDYPGRESMLGKALLFLGGPVAVPVFMLVMSYFMAKNQKTFATNFYRGVKIFIVGFLLNIGLNFHLLLKIVFADWQLNPWEYILGVDIFFFAGIAIMLIALLKTIKKHQAWITLGLALLVAALTSVVNEKLMIPERKYLYPFIGGTWSWSYFPLFPWLVYPLSGFAFYHFEAAIFAFIKNNKIYTSILLVLIALCVAAFAKPGFETTIDLPAYYHHTFWFSLWALGIVILWSLLLRFLIRQFPQTWLGNGLMWLGKKITLFYIIQWLIIGNIATAIYQTQPLSGFPFWFTGIFLVTVLATWLTEKTLTKLAH